MLGEIIRATREKLGHDQLRFAHAMRVSAATASRWESGDRSPGLENRIRMARLAGEPLERFIPEWSADAEVPV